MSTALEPRRRLSHEDRVTRLADLAVSVGANVQPGQDVEVSGDVSHVPIVRAIVQRAYEIGARRVRVDYTDQHVRRSMLKLAPEDALRTAYRDELERIRDMHERQGAMIFLTGTPEPHLFEDLDPKRVAARRSEIDRLFGDLIINGGVAWTVVPAPNPGWATTVFGEPDVERLWDAVATAIRLDEPDPVGAWREHLAILRRRGERLNGLRLDAVHFRGPGTDLTVGLIPESVWVTGSSLSTRGVDFVPNMPTEEVFTSPDLRRTAGSVSTTAPVVLAGGSMVTGLRLRFEAGRIVDVDAETGRDVVLAQLTEDEQAHYLGEVALVDGSSAVGRAGVTFHDMLFDENANSHIAWGAGYTEAVPGSDKLDRDGKLALGLNDAVTHTDIVIGGREVEVDGIGQDGRVTPIIRQDRWVLGDSN